MVSGLWIDEPSARPSREQASRRNFLADALIEHGPRDILSRVILKCDTEMRRMGINLAFATFDELLAVNRANPDSWHPLVSVFDPHVGGVSNENGIALIGWDADGRAVASLASRYYALGAASLKDEIESLRLFYASPEQARQVGEAVDVTAPIAASTRGGAVYLGGLWYHPDFRGKGLHPVISPIVRALSYTRWATDISFSLMSRQNVETGVARRARFPHVEWGAVWKNSPVFKEAECELAVVWTSADEQLAHFREFVADQTQKEARVASSGGSHL
jgi:hypothetical protein